VDPLSRIQAPRRKEIHGIRPIDAGERNKDATDCVWTHVTAFFYPPAAKDMGKILKSKGGIKLLLVDINNRRPLRATIEVLAQEKGTKT
jgi:hypothetical protein